MAEALKDRLRRLRENLLLKSLRAAIGEQGLAESLRSLSQAAPDVSGQYSSFKVEGEYLETKVRGQHAFQIALAQAALNGRPCRVVDVGDSAGTHLSYLKALYPERHSFLSVNLDPEAVSKIRERGLEAVQARAEDLGSLGIDADVFLCFETLEHLPDPFSFLHDLAAKTSCRRLVVSVPYVRKSRLGLHHLRSGLRRPVGAESVHLLELCPEDWKLLFQHCGWRVEGERVYLQYPRFSWLHLTRPLWRRLDFEGFYGAVLSRDPTWSSLYKDWR